MGVFRKDFPSGTEAHAPIPFSAPRALTAAAVSMKLDDKTEAELFRARRTGPTVAWQGEAWEYYDAIGEIKYAFNLVASVVSRIRLYAATVSNASEAPVAVNMSDTISQELAGAAERVLARLDSAYGGQAGLLKDAALNLSVTGECYLVHVPERPSQGLPESWDIRSVDELQIDTQGRVSIAPRRELVSNGSQQAKPGTIMLPPKPFIGRIWRAHPRFSEEPDSSMRGILDLCAELLLLNRSFRATERSRLNAGAMYLPDGLAVSASPGPDYPFTDEEGNPEDEIPPLSPEEAEDEFEDQLIDAMTTPISDEGSASAVVPLLIRGPAELGEKIKQFKFERSFDAALIARGDRVLERILQGLDVPKDVVTGLANVRYSNAIAIDESLFKAHIEPLMLLIVDALTVVFLRPALRANGYTEEEVSRVVVWFDPSAVATRNDRAADADIGYENGAISGDTWRRAHGFSDADAPTATEVALRFIQSHGSLTPELTEAILTAVAPELLGAARQAAQSTSVAPVPSEVTDILNGAQGAPAGAEASQPNAEPSAEAPGAIPTAPAAAATPDESVPPPIPLAEPK